MGLLLHLPFTGDLINRGIGDYNITSVGSYSWVNGKIGQALNLGNATTSTNAIQVNSNMCEDLGEEYTAAVWLYPLGEHPSYNGCVISSGNWNTANKRWSFGVSKDNSQVDAFGFNYNTYVTCSVPVNTWTHIVSVQKNNTAYVYKNGELVATRAMTQAALDSDKTFTNIGMCSYGNYFGFNGYINDLRIYNHALSPLEIKKLSQGLILHYPLNNNGLGGTNLLNNPTKFTAGGAASGNTKTILDDGTAQIVATSGNSNWVRFTDSDTTLPLTKGDTFTFSIRIRSDDSTKNPTVYFNDGLGYFSMKGQMSKNWTTIYYTGTWSIDSLNTIIHLGFSAAPGTYYIQYFKLERGNKPTPLVDNVVFEKSGTIVSNWGSTEGSRQEFRSLDTGVSLPISSGEKLMVSFDLKMIVNTAPSSGSAPYLIMYNSNYRGPHGNWTYVNFNTELAGTYAVGDIIEKRINKIITVGALNPGATRTTDVIEFYSNYGSNNWYEIKNLKIERYNDIEHDVSGYGHNGTYTNPLTFSSSSIRYLVSTYFEDYTKTITCPLNAGTPKFFTMTCWINTTVKAARGGYHVMFNVNSTAYELSIYGAAGKLRAGCNIGGTRYVRDVGPDICDGAWHMVGITYDGSNIKRYVDGVLVDTQAITGNLSSALTTVCLGNFVGGTTYGNTQLYQSDCRFYVTALSEDDILTLYEDSAYIGSDGTSYAYEYVEE